MKETKQPFKPPLLQLLAKTYEANAPVAAKFGNYDLAFKTNEAGMPVLLFMGRKSGNEQIRGERYARRLVYDRQGKIIKDHWEHKGKATP